MSQSEHFFKILSHYLEAMIRIRIEVKGRILILIRIKVTIRIWIRINGIRFRINVMRIRDRNTVWRVCRPLVADLYPDP
jgi:hypothetical protein